MRPRLPGVLPIVFAFLCSGCTSIGYYSQAISGHLGIVLRTKPVEAVLASEDSAPELKRRLGLVLEARDFASSELLLPDNDSYRRYVDTGRRFVTWNVVAAPEFSLDAKQWCFPIAGCIAYRGYFSRDAARAYGADLQAQGWDVAVNGVAAYSTLGWFDDPVLNTMLRWRDDRLVGLIFHELAHQKLYVKDDSDFNEAFAVFIEREGMKRWLEQHGTHAQKLAYQQQSMRKAQFLALLETTRSALAILYQQDIPDSEKRRQKRERFAALLRRYAGLKQTGYAGYDNWFGRELNNARLVSVATYNDLVPVFETLMAQSAGNLATFYDRAEALGRLPAKQRALRLQELGAKLYVDG